MTSDTSQKASSDKNSLFITALREGVGIIQMVLFKKTRDILLKKEMHKNGEHLSRLAGSITNEVFGTKNSEEKFVRFRKDNRADIEQGLLSIKSRLSSLCPILTDALRIQTLCDHQEGIDSSDILVQAKSFGFLMEEREIPLPSTFMTTVRLVGEEHNLITPPVQITPAQDESIIH